MVPDTLNTVLRVVVWILLAAVVGMVARRRQRRFWPWFIVGLILSFLFAMVALGIAEFVAVLKKKKAQGA